MSDDVLKRALASLPHGPEFRFVDRLLSLEPGQRGTGEYTMRGDEPYLKGHFPGMPLLPGVLLIEAIAQLGGTVAQSDPNIPPLAGLKLTAVRNAKILGTAAPGQTVFLSAEVVGRMGNLIQARGEALVEGQRVLGVEVTLAGESVK
ncbi:MAG TPA: 3-hydroxyacyl-ACP dehydratase FabZ family protein [Verrucomicrobiae bacterium]